MNQVLSRRGRRASLLLRCVFLPPAPQSQTHMQGSSNPSRSTHSPSSIPFLSSFFRSLPPRSSRQQQRCTILQARLGTSSKGLSHKKAVGRASCDITYLYYIPPTPFPWPKTPGDWHSNARQFVADSGGESFSGGIKPASQPASPSPPSCCGGLPVVTSSGLEWHAIH